MSASRTPAIMADSAHVIMTSDSRATTDNFFMDDEVLISNGATIDDLQKYMQTKNGKLSDLKPDGFC